MRPRAELDFIRDRVLAEIAAHPSQRPFLGEPAPRARQQRCPRCDSEIVTRPNGDRLCSPCDARRRREKRASERVEVYRATISFEGSGNGY